MARAAGTPVTAFRWAVFVASLAPLVWLLWAWHSSALGVFPEERLVHLLGEFGLLLLLLTLATGPAFRLSSWRGFMAVRRQLGLWSYCYLMLHALVWAGLQMGWDWPLIAIEVRELAYLQLGLVSLVILTPLALTSVPAAPRLLGLRRWRRLHRLAYVAAAAGIVHYWLVVRVDSITVWLATATLLLLVAFRLLDAWRGRR